MNLNDTIEMMTKATNESYANMRKLAEINLATMDALTAKQMEIFKLCLDTGAKQADLMKDAKRVDEVVGSQTEAARELGEKLVESNREVVEIITQSRDSYQNWAEESVKQVKAQAETVTKAARKAA